MRTVLIVALLISGWSMSYGVADAQESFSWFGNQILKNSSETIPPGKQYSAGFSLSERSRVRLDFTGSVGEHLDTYLLTHEEYRKGGAGKWIQNVEGNGQIVRILDAGEYALVVQNISTFAAQSVHIRIWVQKP